MRDTEARQIAESWEDLMPADDANEDDWAEVARKRLIARRVLALEARCARIRETVEGVRFTDMGTLTPLQAAEAAKQIILGALAALTDNGGHG